MLKCLTTITVAVGLMIAGSLINRAEAMPLGNPSGMGIAKDDLNIVSKIQFFWGDREYCWYDDGWH